MSDAADRPRPARDARPTHVRAPEVSVIIPTYKRAGRLAGVVQALSKQTLSPERFEVVGVDNFSQDDTFETLLVLAATVPFSMRVLQTESNHGPAPARNLGWRSATAPIVAFLDDDCLPDPDWLANGLAVMASDESLGVVQGRVRTPDDFDPTNMAPWYHCQIIDGPTPFFEACNIFYRRAALEATGGFDEGFGWWGEDSALGWSVVEGGWERGFADQATVVHAVVQRGWRWHFDNGLLDRNMMKVARRHRGFRAEAFWQPWIYRRDDAAFMVAVLGVLAALRFRPALVLALPYVWIRRPRGDVPDPIRFMVESMAVDAARSTGQLRAALDRVRAG
ncbi:MAG TPA: glycosyltransferase [Acidimicrobiales bacterium]|nr:glycosyltransferase [Acidimicrobiales bacterium]